MQADDPDEGENAEIRFIISSGNEDGDFNINETTGEVYARHALDFETKPMYVVNITAQNVKPFEGNMKTRANLPSIMQLLINVVVSDLKFYIEPEPNSWFIAWVI